MIFPQFSPISTVLPPFLWIIPKREKPGSLTPPGFSVVEVVGFEPTAFWSRTKRATRLRYTSKDGADKGTRTLDLMITNQPLYQLSYIGTPTIPCQREIL